jgi:Protein of unknown function (DUF4231)
MTPDQYVTDRVDDQIKWLSARGAGNQSWFMRLRAVELLLASCLPFLAAYADQLAWSKVVLGAIGVVIAVLAGILSLYKFQENWIEYRSTAEALKREKFLFLTGVGDYAGDQAFSAFVARIESVLGSESARWVEHAGVRRDSG